MFKNMLKTFVRCSLGTVVFFTGVGVSMRGVDIATGLPIHVRPPETPDNKALEVVNK